uniref:Uncharacterized protein n=1 Tax=Oryza nivara TaxID=4536 RepID=A0A0E0IQ32_ORYNI
MNARYDFQWWSAGLYGFVETRLPPKTNVRTSSYDKMCSLGGGSSSTDEVGGLEGNDNNQHRINHERREPNRVSLLDPDMPQVQGNRQRKCKLIVLGLRLTTTMSSTEHDVFVQYSICCA